MFTAFLAACFATPARDLESPDHRPRSRAELTLAGAWPYTVPALRKAQGHPSAEVRRRAASAERSGAARALGMYARFPVADWPALVVIRADTGEAGGLPHLPPGAEEAALAWAGPDRIAAVARAAGWLDGNERLTGEEQTGESWWDTFPTVSLQDVRTRARGVPAGGFSGWYRDENPETGAVTWRCPDRDAAAAEWQQRKPKW